MNKRSVVVDRVSEVAPGGEVDAKARRVVVRFQGGEEGFLDPSDPRSSVWAEVLESQRRADKPVYVEIDPQSKAITELLLPRALEVDSITPSPDGDGVVVDLIISHARHFVRRSNPRYAELVKALETARKRRTPVLVTETQDTHEIINVSPAQASTQIGGKRRR